MKNKKEKSNSKISCDVNSCKHNNIDDKCCELDSIEISCTCSGDKCDCVEETVCQSFKSTGGNITDNEYEVASEIDAEAV